jgi:PIN domain nuclease of toxin-antitoxin system
LKLFLDTHVLAWWLLDEAALSRRAFDLVCDPDNLICIGSPSLFEMAWKEKIGKWPDIGTFLSDPLAALSKEGIEVFDLTARDVLLAAQLASDHRDPFDRMIAAQAVNAGAVLVTADPGMAGLGVATIW